MTTSPDTARPRPGRRKDRTPKFPFITLKVIWLIHWQAFRLWLKRVPFYWKETRAEDQRGVFRPHKSLRKHAQSSSRPERA